MPPQGKWDPGNLSMDWFRTEVQKDLDGFVFPGEQPVQHPDPGPVPDQSANTAATAQRAIRSPTARRYLGSVARARRQRMVPARRQDGCRLPVEIGEFATYLHRQLDELRAMQSVSGPNGQPGAPAKKAAAKKVAAKKTPAKKPPRGSAAKRAVAKRTAATRAVAKKTGAKKTARRRRARKEPSPRSRPRK